MEDYYTTLGVDRGASADEIKQAYRRLAHKYHPDKDGGDEEKFKEVNTAYQVLGDREKRSQYDRFGSTFDQAGTNGPFGGGFNVNIDDFGDIGSIFDTFFGRTRSSSAQQRKGSDVNIDLTISFEESAKGTKKDITHRIFQTCSHCRGNKAEPGTPITTCSVCKGKGTVSQTQQSILGVFTQSTKCKSCDGQGSTLQTPCQRCRGEGRELKERTLTIDVPAGIGDRQTIRLSGKGEAPAGQGNLGDLYISIHVQPHKVLRREGDNTASSVNVSFVDAALGTNLTIDTLDGPRKLTIPPGTQPGTPFTLSGLGFPSLHTRTRGDHVITTQIQIPKKLSRKQKQLLNEFQQTKPKRHLFS
jgi:molecular chaperone DnaJ